MTKRSKNRRKTLVVNQELQKRIVLHVTLYPLLALFISALTVTVFSGRLAQEAAALRAELPSLGLFFASVVGFVIIFGLLLIRQALVFSNKVAGPTYRICKNLSEFREGNRDLRIRLREGDFNTEIATEINLLLDCFAEQDKKISALDVDAVQSPIKSQRSDEVTATK